MNNRSMKKILFLILFISQATNLRAQSNYKYELGGGIGTFIYQGDLTPSRFGSFRTMRPGFQIFLNRIVTSSFLFRTNLAFGGLHGDDAKYGSPEFRRQRNFNFRSPVWEFTQLFLWNPVGSNYRDKGLSAYFFGGGGLSRLKIKRDWSKYNAEYFDAVSNETALLAEDINHFIPKIIPVITMGAGIRYDLSTRLSFTLEGSYRLIFTDYLDGFSKAANPSLDDHYHTIMVNAIYRIDKKNRLNCPVIRR